jgi:outer membrane lipoprotein-sorting protein
MFKKLHMNASAQLDEKVHSAISDALAESEKMKPAVVEPNIWRVIMKSRITQLSAAAVIIIGILLSVGYFGVDGTSVAWAEVAEKTQQISTWMFRSWATVTVDMPGAQQITETETVTYADSEYGMRNETYMNEKLSSVMYMNPHKEWIVTVMPETKSYMRMKLTDELLAKQQQEQEKNDPKALAKLFTSFGYTVIGRSTIDGVEVEGIEVDDSRIFEGMFESFKGRLWVDVQTDLPVRIEYECSALNGEMQMKMTMGEFQWGLELDPSEFEPNIPDDYTLMAEVQMPSTKDEGRIIEGLHLFSKIVDGKYPSSLDMMTPMKEVGDAFRKRQKAVEGLTGEAQREAKESLREILGFEKNEEPGKKPSPEQMKKFTNIMMILQTPTWFYMQLVQQGKDPAYYGDKVTAEDADAVLLRWKISDTKYRVIFGDLTTENVTVEQLAELEKASTK